MTMVVEAFSRESRKSPMAITSVPAIGNALYFPVRLMIWPETMEVVSMPAIIGSSCIPDWVGVRPRTTWRNVGR